MKKRNSLQEYKEALELISERLKSIVPEYGAAIEQGKVAAKQREDAYKMFKDNPTDLSKMNFEFSLLEDQLTRDRIADKRKLFDILSEKKKFVEKQIEKLQAEEESANLPN